MPILVCFVIVFVFVSIYVVVVFSASVIISLPLHFFMCFFSFFVEYLIFCVNVELIHSEFFLSLMIGVCIFHFLRTRSVKLVAYLMLYMLNRSYEKYELRMMSFLLRQNQ